MKADASHITPARLPRALDQMVRLRPARAWMVVLLCADLAALGDLVTGPDLWFGPAYLLVMCLATWALGWRAGQATGIGCMLLTFGINGTHLYPFGTAHLAWNLAMRFVALSFVIAIIAGVRRAYVREWWLARTDMLTGALNRQAFFELGGPLASTSTWRLLIYADLDGLKAINDGQGHAAGDACLRAFADAVRRLARRDDMFARVGGDEFLIFMAVNDESSARAAATRLHAAMNRIATTAGERLRCSVGALMVPPRPLSIDDLVRRADCLMYEAKLRGACLEFGMVSHGERSPLPVGARPMPRMPASAWSGLAERRSDEIGRPEVR